MVCRNGEESKKTNWGRLTRLITRPPFRDEFGHKGWMGRFSWAQPHAIRHIRLELAEWPRWSRPLRVAFLSDFHTGSHTKDVERLHLIVDELARYLPDLAVFGGDYVNLQLWGGGRVPPRTIAAVLGRLVAPLGRFAILGNHDYCYDRYAVTQALEDHGTVVLEHNRRRVMFENFSLHIAGISDAKVARPQAQSLLKSLPPEPTIVLAHDPVWFGSLPPGPYIMLAGHTHGGQVRIPGLGVIKNSSKAPLRWTYGLIKERNQLLYVTSGVGTSVVPIRWRVPPEVVVMDLNGTGRVIADEGASRARR